MVELVDTLCSGRSVLAGVRVQIPPSAFIFNIDSCLQKKFPSKLIDRHLNNKKCQLVVVTKIIAVTGTNIAIVVIVKGAHQINDTFHFI